MTIKEIAEKAGVSIGTVDRALHGRGRVSQATAEKIRLIAGETGYSPDPHASHLSTARRYRIAVLKPRSDQDGGFWNLTEEGISRASRELAQLRVTLDAFPFDRYSGDSLVESIRLLEEYRPDGIVLAPVIPGPVEKFLASLNPSIPFVLIDTDLPTVHPLSYIGQDAHRSGRLAARLLSLVTGGSPDVVAIRPVSPDFHIADRIAGFLEGYAPGIRPTVVVEERFEESGVSEKLLDRLFSESAPEGIFIANSSGYRIAEYLLKRSGELPSVKVIGYDLIPANRRYLELGCITFLLSQKPELQAYEAVYTLYRKLALNQNPYERIHMPIDILTSENLEHYR